MAKENRGLASIPRWQNAIISSAGGRAGHVKGTAHEFTSEEARKAGSKGGKARAKKMAEARRNALPKVQER